MRHWWAGENHSNRMPELTAFGSLEGTDWVWKDESWNVDTSGDCRAIHGGYESCTNLVGGREKCFSPFRTFNPSHRFRRRRWYRRKVKARGRGVVFDDKDDSIDEAISSFHQPILDVKSGKKSKDKKKPDNDPNAGLSFLDGAPESEDDGSLKVYFKVGDSTWSSPAIVPPSGAAHGVLRIPASRWPTLSKAASKAKMNSDHPTTANILPVGVKGRSKIEFNKGCLSSKYFDICYRVTTIEGQWGEHSRLLMLYPRFYIRNDSEEWHMDVKQAGASDRSAIRLKPGSSKPFYWTNAELPDLLCVRPAHRNNFSEEETNCWSGGFDITSLGMVPLRIREDRRSMTDADKKRNSVVSVVRSLIELRSGTGGTGISVSIKEELTNGEDSLYRIENHSPFPLWIAQDGILTNPGGETGKQHEPDVIGPNQRIAYGLDNPFRQGKYAGRKAASLEELLRLRVGLAPLASRDGIESTKVISLSRVGANMRLKPAKLRTFFDEDTIVDLMCVNVQGIVSSDGPTRVLKFT